jgi:tetratricopeptide (TPR) repeat protein
MANLPSVSSRAWLSWSLAEQGGFALAIKRANEAALIAEAVDHLVSRVYAYMALGIAYLRKGEINKSISNLERALNLSEEANLRMARAMVVGYLGRAYTIDNQATKAVEILSEVVHDAASMELLVDQGMRLVHLGEAYLRAGQWDRAISMAKLALQTAQDYSQCGARAWGEWLLGEIYSGPRTLEKGEGYYRTAIKLASELGMSPLVAQCHFSIGKAQADIGKGELAREHFSQAASMYRNLEMQIRVLETEAYLQGL